jgi:hypothetical protein
MDEKTDQILVAHDNAITQLIEDVRRVEKKINRIRKALQAQGLTITAAEWLEDPKDHSQHP